MKPANRYLAIASILFLPAAAGAENLQQAWSDAVASHKQLAAADARREAAGLNLESAQAERWPQLGVTSSFTQLDQAPRFDFGGGTTSEPLFDNDNFLQAGVQVSLPLYAGGAISAGVRRRQLLVRGDGVRPRLLQVLRSGCCGKEQD